MKFIIGIITTICALIVFWHIAWFCVVNLAEHMARLHRLPLESTYLLAQVIVFGIIGVLGLCALAYLGRSKG